MADNTSKPDVGAQIRPLLQRAAEAVNAGHFDTARALCADVFAIAPGSLAAMWHYVTVTRMAPDDQVLSRIKSALQAGGLDPNTESQLRFMLGKSQDDMGQTRAAFGQFVKANALKPAHHNSKASAGLAKALIGRVQAAPRLALEPTTPRMVFVLGMPRSGTSLLSQMLAAHPAISNLGEMTALGAGVTAAGQGQNPTLGFLEDLSEARLRAAREAYLAAIPDALRSSGQILVDKMPENYWLAWVIPMLFPDAVIVHMRRDRLATCWSCFRNDFRHGHEYAYDFQNLLAHWDQHMRLVTAFRTREPAPWLSLKLDRVTQAPKQALTPVLHRLGLEWDDACAAPEKAGGDMATLSKWQVRQGIDPNIAKGWKAYLPLIQEKWGITK